MASANKAQAILKKEKANSCYSFIMYEYVGSRQLRSEMAAEINGSNGYTRADISSAQIRRGGVQWGKCRSCIPTTFQLRRVHIRCNRDFSVHQDYVDPAPATTLF
jgi:hypothetical protein